MLLLSVVVCIETLCTTGPVLSTPCMRFLHGYDAVMTAERYPPATWRGDGQSGGSYTAGPWRLVLHTTETRTIPGYQDGATAPHLTYFPAARTWTQHTTLATAARALRNEPGGVETNRARALQVEIVAYSDLGIADRYGGLRVDQLSDGHKADLAAFVAWCHAEFGVQLGWPGKVAASYSAANAPGFRMTGAQWLAFAAVCSHQHLPEQTHWDTGIMDVGGIIDLAGSPEEDYLYPIALKDGSETQRPTANGFIRSMQTKLRQMGVKGGGTGGVAFRGFLDAVFGVVGSPLGGSYISGEEGAAFDLAWLQALGTPGAPGPAGPVGKTGPRGPAGPPGVDGAKVQITVDDVVVHP